MRLTERESKIIIELLDNKISLSDLADKCKLSTKTLKSDIDTINQKIIEFNSKIIISNKQLIFESIYTPVHWRNIVKLNKTIEEEDLIFLKLVFKDHYITLSDFAAELYMSKSKLEKIFATVPHFNLYVTKKRNVGIYVDIPKDEKIMLAISILLPYVDDLNYLVTTRALIQQVTDEDIEISKFNLYIQKFNSVVNGFKTVTDKECKIIFLIICLNNELLNLEQNVVTSLINKHINDNQGDENLRLIISNCVQKVLTSNNIQVNNQKIFKIFIEHIEKSITSRQTNTINEEMELRLRTEYSQAYSLAHELYSKICVSLSVNIEEYEKNYYALYIQSIINSQSNCRNLNILIVCQYGLSVSNYIKTWLEQKLELQVKFTITSIHNYWQSHSNEKKYDVIITTVDNLENDFASIVKIDSIPLEEQLHLVERKIINLDYQSQIDSFLNYYSLKSISIANIDQMYNIISVDLNEKNTEFINLMKKRTDEGLTAVNGIIIMHSDGTQVKTSKMIVYKLEKPIKYNEKQITMIFVFAFTIDFINEYNNVIKQIYKVLYLDQYVHALYETSNEKQFTWIFKNQLKQKMII